MNSDMFMTRVLDNLSQDRRFETAFEIFLVIDLVIEQDHQIKKSCRNHHTQEQTDNAQCAQSRRTAQYVHLRGIENLRRHGCRCQHQCVLFAFLVEEEIELFFDFLITNHLYILAFHLRSVFDLAVVLGILRLEVVQLDFQALAHRTDGSDDILTHGSQLLIHLFDNRVVVRRGTLDAHFLQQDSVILREACFQRSIRNSDIGRDKIVTLGLVAQETVHVVHKAQLGLQFHHRLLLGTAGLQEQTCLSLDIGYVILLLICRYCLLRFQQFLLDLAHSLVDESGGIGCYHVLVNDGIHVVLLDHLEKQSFVADRERGDHRQRDDIRLFLIECHTEVLLIAHHCQLVRAADGTIGGIRAQRTVGMQTNRTHSRLKGFIQCLHAMRRTNPAVEFYLDLIPRAGRLDRNSERGTAGLLGQLQALDGEGVLAVFFLPLHSVFDKRRLP